MKKIITCLIVSMWLGSACAAQPETFGEISDTKVTRMEGMRAIGAMGSNWTLPTQKQLKEAKKLPDGIYWGEGNCMGKGRCVVGVGVGVEYNWRKTTITEAYSIAVWID
jgi:hypothetical protein